VEYHAAFIFRVKMDASRSQMTATLWYMVVYYRYYPFSERRALQDSIQLESGDATPPLKTGRVKGGNLILR
jgi:hypothetical protein